MLLETTTALDAIKFKTNLEKSLTTKASQYAKLIYRQALKYGAYNDACSEYVQDWYFYSIEESIKQYCKSLPFSVQVFVASLGKDTNASTDPKSKIVYINDRILDGFVKTTISELSTFVYAPNNPHYNESDFSEQAIADGMFDGYLYSTSSDIKNKFIATLLHEISHLQQIPNDNAKNAMLRSVSNNDKIEDNKEQFEDYSSQSHEIDAFANGEVAKYILDNPDYTLSDIKTQTVYLTKKYSQFGDITLSNETKKKFATKVFKLLYQHYHQK